MHLTILTLPPELLDKIIACASKKSQLDLRSVSRHFEAIATPHGYQTIHLKTWPRVLRCFRTLASSDKIARVVRSILIRTGVDQWKPTLLAGAYRIILQGFESISPYIVDLNLLNFKIVNFPLPTHCPRLCNFSTSLSMAPHLASFISRHPNIETLMLPDIKSGFTPPAMRLPSMVSLMCLSNIAVSLVPGSQVSQIEVMWDPLITPDDLEAFFASLKEKSVPILSFTSYYWNPGINMFPLISENMPYLKQIALSGSTPLGAVGELLYQGMNDILPTLENLVSITIKWDTPLALTPAVMDKELDTLIFWGQLCPSLEICYMPSRLEWRRLKNAGSAWIPDPGANRESIVTCASWMKDRLASGTAPDFMRTFHEKVAQFRVSDISKFISLFCDTWAVECQDIAEYRGLRAFEA